ncbi:hypothetical protein NDI43_24185 [Microcoleus vaginatus GB2-A3]|uniref:hypothetical protein n=1 Tax=Microcoleus vaginatus TaxID=119532 RepID=UPI0032AAC447
MYRISPRNQWQNLDFAIDTNDKLDRSEIGRSHPDISTYPTTSNSLNLFFLSDDIVSGL